MKIQRIAAGTAAVALATLGVAGTAHAADHSTTVPGHQGRDGTVVGHYTSLYAEDDAGDWYWDLGDGRVMGSVDGVGDLDPDTVVTCDYQVIYRGDFGDDPSLDDGWIKNNIRCDDGTTYNSTYVSSEDPRYTGEHPIWGTWDIVVSTVSGQGNTV
ncbi:MULTISPECIES: hypothetical protein [unclassified Isoptericola]|uniref:hypothetical protein n=1 Tax=unclassified Isoptericola TaxID=2623355 RepID=UPI0027134971|nr:MULTISPECIES: hypothetical protein [unclassified Isoptericola]MDO8144922.1 hypothetical protein [Isoptericola sp. 178]MDO8149701.1 hypothetical protein [Isoptericola sp. b515]